MAVGRLANRAADVGKIRAALAGADFEAIITGLNEAIATSKVEIKCLALECKQFKSERDRYKELYLSMLELCKKLELGIVGQKRERYVNDAQLSLSFIEMLTNANAKACRGKLAGMAQRRNCRIRCCSEE